MEEAPSPDTPEEPTDTFGRVPSAGGLESVPLPEGAVYPSRRSIMTSVTLPSSRWFSIHGLGRISQPASPGPAL